MKENTAVYIEQDTQLLGMQMLHPSQVHGEHGSFGLCKGESVFSHLSQTPLHLLVHKPRGSPQTFLVVHTCNVEVHLGRL